MPADHLMRPELLDHPGLSTRFVDGEIVLLGRLVSASNQTFLAELSGPTASDTPDVDVTVDVDEPADPDERAERVEPVKAVYKPVAGERPLWDFPDRTLGFREVAAYQLSDLAGFHLVPYTTWVEGPLGPGSLQVWVDDDPDDCVVDLVPTEDVEVEEPRGRYRRRFADLVRYDDRDWYSVLDGLDGSDHDVTLLHAQDDRLRSMALFDAVINNADRKGGHIIASGGRLFGVDHGISFHPENKLRTLLWGWAGEPLTEAELDQVRACGGLADALAELLGEEDTEALVRRCARLLVDGAFPRPNGSRHTIPWPPW